MDLGDLSLVLDVGVHSGLWTWGGAQGFGRGEDADSEWGVRGMDRLPTGSLGAESQIEQSFTPTAQGPQASSPGEVQYRCPHQGPPAASLAGSLSLYGFST